jgi:hypothetical protein
MATRPWHLQQARGSYAQLVRILGELSEEEVLAALALEAQSTRRATTIDRLIARAVGLRTRAYKATLDEQFR